MTNTNKIGKASVHAAEAAHENEEYTNAVASELTYRGTQLHIKRWDVLDHTALNKLAEVSLGNEDLGGRDVEENSVGKLMSSVKKGFVYEVGSTPIIAASVNGKDYIVDGRHRRKVANELKASWLVAYVTRPDGNALSEEEIEEAAYEANDRHPQLPTKPNDMQSDVDRLLSLHAKGKWKGIEDKFKNKKDRKGRDNALFKAARTYVYDKMCGWEKDPGVVTATVNSFVNKSKSGSLYKVKRSASGMFGKDGPAYVANAMNSQDYLTLSFQGVMQAARVINKAKTQFKDSGNATYKVGLYATQVQSKSQDDYMRELKGFMDSLESLQKTDNVCLKNNNRSFFNKKENQKVEFPKFKFDIVMIPQRRNVDEDAINSGKVLTLEELGYNEWVERNTPATVI
jgi:hypothetical protein